MCAPNRCHLPARRHDWGNNGTQELNEIIAAKGSSEAVNQVVDDLAHDKIEVFRGPYTGVDQDDARDRIDLSEGYTENAERSAPSFHWILDEVVSVVE